MVLDPPALENPQRPELTAAAGFNSGVSAITAP